MVRACCAALLVMVGLAGCYGTTEPATEITQDNARLNARGTANNGTAYSYFEYGFAAENGFSYQTPTRAWPAGASGPFSDLAWREGEGPLYPSTTYQFRVCGSDSRAGPFVCANTRTFTTAAPTRDAAKGYWFTGPNPYYPWGSVNASAGPAGQSPTGVLRLAQATSPNSVAYFAGRVTCLRVAGVRAVVGAVGHTEVVVGNVPPPEVDPNGTPDGSARATFIDGGPSSGSQDTVGTSKSSSTTPPDCSAGPTADRTAMYGSVNVYDAR